MRNFIVSIITTVGLLNICNAQCNLSLAGNKQGSFTGTCNDLNITGVIDDDINIAAACGDLIFVPPLADPGNGTIHTEILSKEDIRIYPNPTSGQFTIEWPEIMRDAQISVYNALGQRVYHRKVDQVEKIQIDLSSGSNGIYLVKIRTSASEEYTGRIIKYE